MTKALVAGFVVAVLVAGGVSIASITSGPASAQERAPAARGETAHGQSRTPVETDAPAEMRPAIDDALADLVSEDVITQDQADAVRQRLAGAFRSRHEGGFGRGEHGVRGDFGNFGSFFDALGMTPPEIMTALQSGSSIADLAADAGLDVDALVADVVAVAETQLRSLVDAGRLDNETAATRLAEIEQWITEMVNGEFESGSFGPFGRRGFGHGSHTRSDAEAAGA